ncbi:hypothetical protein [Phenylobacterium montanum]|uniref:Uncharacterized protein n=1 Tax=Phenylobacterium montanum TaxID=2823693 RepID=A0A975FXS8_9CAUL|nr:hypothetical protein [Caulobacter sp. S6]QUD87184.1 hypothetical protein KCG34_19315 [Caulobacter sp. S6]
MPSQSMAPPSPPPAGSLPLAVRIALVALPAACFPAGAAILALNWWNNWAWLGLFLLTLSPMAAMMAYLRLFRRCTMRPAQHRYQRRQAMISIVYVFVLMAAVELFKLGYAKGPLGYAVAVAPALPIIGMFWALGRYVAEETDELKREITRASLMWSGGLTLCEATVLGFLENFGLAPHLWLWVVPVAFFVQLGATTQMVSRRYR